MIRTPDSFPGERFEDGIVLDERFDNPVKQGGIRYVSGSFRMKDDIGVFNPRSLPKPTNVGSILYAVTTGAFVEALPIVSRAGHILTQRNGQIIVSASL